MSESFKNQMSSVCGKKEDIVLCDSKISFNRVCIGPTGATDPARSVSNYVDFYALMPTN